MPIYFKELEIILNEWKIYQSNNSGNKISENELKKRVISRITDIFELVKSDNVIITEEANLDRTYGKIYYENIIKISIPKSKL